MTPRLPPELLSHILALAREGEPPLARRAIGRSFRHVCRDWYLAQDSWSEVSADGPDQIEAVAKLLAAPAGPGQAPLGERVRSVFIGAPSRMGKNKMDKAVNLIAAVPLVQNVEIGVAHQGLCNIDLLGNVVCDALGKLVHVKHFSLICRAYKGNQCYQNLLASHLALFLPSWTELETFVLQVNLSGYGSASHNPLSNKPKLNKVVVKEPELLRTLSSRVRCVALSDYCVLAVDTSPTTVPYENTTTARLASNLALIAPSLHELALAGSVYEHRRPPILRGHHARLISSLRDVRRLSIPAFAVTDLAQALVPLVHLERVDVSASSAVDASARAIGPDEVVQLVLSVPALAKLSLAQAIVSHWTDEGRRAVREAAEQKGVQLVDVGGWGA